MYVYLYIYIDRYTVHTVYTLWYIPCSRIYSGYIFYIYIRQLSTCLHSTQTSITTVRSGESFPFFPMPASQPCVLVQNHGAQLSVCLCSTHWLAGCSKLFQAAPPEAAGSISRIFWLRKGEREVILGEHSAT